MRWQYPTMPQARERLAFLAPLMMAANLGVMLSDPRDCWEKGVLHICVKVPIRGHLGQPPVLLYP